MSGGARTHAGARRRSDPAHRAAIEHLYETGATLVDFVR
jgi:hypothetical protein